LIEIPSGLAWWRRRPDGAAWLERLPRLVAECAELWALRVATAYPGSNVSLVAPVERADGTLAVLKISFPELWENEQEGDALAHWDGRGAVRLLERDRERRALLIERCVPGSPLRWIRDEDGANAIATAVLRRLWRPAPGTHPFRLLADDAVRWAETFPDAWEQLRRPFERALVDAAVAAVRELAPTQGDPVVLHQDFHSGNVLRAEREPWLAIDPQPLVGEREYDAASLLRDRLDDLLADPSPGRRLRRRLDAVAGDLALDRERIHRWGVVHALAWGVSAAGRKLEADMVACARLLIAA
jgi:streptomycin 6-kinase